MLRLHCAALLVSIASFVFLMPGCNSGSKPHVDADGPAADVHDDHAGHDHSHEALGPHGGHLLELGQEQYHAEWTHDDKSNTITVYFLDAEAKEGVAIEPDSAQIVVTIEGSDPVTYDLQPTSAESDPSAVGFTNDDTAILTGVRMVGHGVQAKLHVSIAGEPFSTEFEHLAHDDHGHQH